VGRPTIKRERTREILDAFEVCVARYGVEGATLERIAEQAGLARPLIRHHVGNREDLLRSLTDRFVKKWHSQTDAMIAMLPDLDRSAALIDILFDETCHDRHMARVAEALIAAAGERPQIGRDIAAWIRAFVEAISEQLRADHPDAAATDVEVVASGIAGLYFTVDSIASLAEMQDLRMASRQSAHRLAASLGERRNP